MQTELKGNWRLLALPNEEVKKTGFAPVHTAEFAVRNDTIWAEVPGCMELDLFRAGLAPDPFFAGNPLVYQQFENRHLWYYTEFDAPEGTDELLFEGVDTIAEIYLNGALLGRAENMMIGDAQPHSGVFLIFANARGYCGGVGRTFSMTALCTASATGYS